MADDVPYVEDPAVLIAADEIGGVKYQRVKVVLGADGVNGGDVSAANPLPVTLPATAATAARQDAGNTSVGSIDTKTPALGQALAAVSVPIVLTALQQAALTPPGAITGFALETGGHLAAIDTSAARIPAQGQALAAASTPVVLTAIQQAALTPPAAITGFALDATLTGGNAKAIARGGAKGATAAADITSTASGANHQAADVILYDAAGNVIDPRLIRAIASGTDSITVVGTVTANLAAGTNNIGDVDVLTLPAVVGGKTNNNAAPGATNLGAIIGIANEALPSYTEGNLVMPAYDLRGVLRTIGVPLANLGVYGVMFKTGTYAGLAANTPLASWRWGDATRFCALLRVQIIVITSAAATAAAITERQLIHARAFTASDTGGTSFLPTGNSQKRRTSMGTTLMTDMRAGAPITAGTRTLDGAPASSLAGWSGLLSTGLAIGACGSSAVGAARSTEGGTGFADLFNALNGQDYPQTYAQNEGSVIRIGAVQPTGSTQETWGIVTWLEANKVY